MDRALSAGVNFIDVADVYGQDGYDFMQSIQGG